MLISSFELRNENVISTLLSLPLRLDSVWTNTDRLFEFVSVNCLNDIVQSAVNAQREEDQNLNSSVVAKTLMLLTNSSYG